MAPKRKPPDLEEECYAFMQKMFYRRERPDVKVRKALAKDTVVSCVKTTMNSFCKDEAKTLAWDGILRDMNKTVAEAYLLANLHVLRLCEAGLPMPKFDQDFCYNCLSAVSVTGRKKSNIKDVHLRESAELYYTWRPENYKPPSSAYLSSGWHQSTSLQMVTNIHNNVSTNFWRRFRRYLKHKHSLEGKDAYELMMNISSSEYDGTDTRVLEYKAWFPTRNIGPIQDHPQQAIPILYRILCYFESQHPIQEYTKEAKHLRLFSLLPFKRGFECSHFKMCNNGLYGLLKRSGVEDLPSNDKAWRAVADTWWRKLFNIDQFETENRKFAGEVMINGKAVSIVLRRPKHPQSDSAPAIDLPSFDTIWGLDPGRRDLFHAANVRDEFQSCSTREFYEDAHYKKSNQKIKGWYDRSPDILEGIRNMPCKKTASLVQLKVYADFLLPRLDRLLAYHMERPFRKLKLKRYIMAQKKMRELVRRFAGDDKKRVLVGFGDWSNLDNGGLIKKCPPGPVKRFKRELSRVCTVVEVDEFRSSKLHWDCHQTLVNQQSHRRCKDGVERKLKVHSVLHCRHNGCNGMTVNRDRNAARNILRLLVESCRGRERHVCFQRGHDLTAITNCSWLPRKGLAKGSLGAVGRSGIITLGSSQVTASLQ
ncbi:MAG: transposase [Thermoplasmata archaeon]|uniref:Transposase n=1 Tax=Candidatus Sysuiplasma superficiale TaxID=2823368 RepID=A0A8J8CIU4_9ARCH|nr:transposase [Candidatus Sysuiplasma superficiale]